MHCNVHRTHTCVILLYNNSPSLFLLFLRVVFQGGSQEAVLRLATAVSADPSCYLAKEISQEERVGNYKLSSVCVSTCTCIHVTCTCMHVTCTYMYILYGVWAIHCSGSRKFAKIVNLSFPHPAPLIPAVLCT